MATSPRLTSAPPVTCGGTIGASDPVAIVTFHGQSTQVLRDYVDEAHPRTVCSFGDGLFVNAILDPHHLVASFGPTAIVVEVPSGKVFELGIDGIEVAVAPDLSQVLWFSSTDPPALHDSWSGGDKVIQYYPTPAGMCGGGPWPGAFSRDSRYGFAIWNQGPAATFLNIVGNRMGVFAVSPPTGGWGNSWQNPPGFAMWSPVADKLYYLQQGAVWTWTPSGGASELRPGLAWAFPTMAGDGKHLAYVLWSSDFSSATVHLMDPTTGADIGQIGAGQRNLPMFLTNDLIWLRSEAQGCGPSQPTSYIYDLRDKSETPSSLDWVSATWPGTSSLGG